ncbi:heme NO-binding domain-containing protein [Pontibacter silvestris]|uniref:Heme NO-binding domain-containing protein n=1 Tax=Pontibacter silvestris TaxID=2305183 RepID=A0ABW4WTC8_9BACT|nr:heme NO-binding domain-containing protein [Pontibacter silvestris]MCC9138044.1 heme NO-binding domain-containing protein [Pontibacter silvestris]
MEKHPPTEDSMHGSIFVLLKRFVENLYDYSTWVRLLEDAGIRHAPYQMDGMYPTSEIFTIVHKASALTGVPPQSLMEEYGAFLVPDLLLVYKRYMQPEWRTYEMLLNTEGAMHAAVKKEDERATPPLLLVTKKGSRQLIVDYHSRRRMAAVAIGIIKGIAKYYDESEKVEVTLLTPVGEERVQIRVDFLP